MKLKAIVIALFLSLISSLNAAYIEVILTADLDGSTAATPSYGGSLQDSLDDNFNYNPNDPTAVMPNLTHTTADGGGYVPVGNVNPVVLSYTFDALSLTSADSFAVDLYGRDNNKSRDDNFDLVLYNGADELTRIDGNGIDDLTDHKRVTFNVDGTFDRLEVVGYDDWFTLMEIRAAVDINSDNISATPEPSSYALMLISFCGLIAAGKRQKNSTY